MKCQINGFEINYRIKGKGFPLLMVHGYSLDHRVLIGCMEPLMKEVKGFQRIYFDLPGMGKTPASDTIQTSQDMLDVVIQFINKLLPSQSFAIIGQSYGGYLARGIAHQLQSRVAGMLLICPVTDFVRSKRRVPDLVVLKKDNDLLSELSMLDAEEFQQCVVLQTREVWNRFNQDILPGVRLADFSLLERVRDTEFSFDPDAKAGSYFKPVSILLARFDNSVGYQDGMKLLDKYPRSNLLVADSAGHNLQFEQVKLFNATAKKWLSDIKENLSLV